MKGAAGGKRGGSGGQKRGERLKGELLSMAERGRRESKNERCETDGENGGEGDPDEEDEAGEDTIRGKMNGELRTSGLRATKKLKR